MLLLLVILLSVLLSTSVILTFLMFRVAERQSFINNIYEHWIEEWRKEVFKIWTHMKLLDDKQMFEKDDEVGIVFQDMKMLIKSLNDKIEEETEEGEE